SDEQQIGTRRLQIDYLRVDRGIRDVVSSLGNDHRCLAAEGTFQSGEVIAAEIVVLKKHGYLGVRLCSKNVVGINPLFDQGRRVKSGGPGKIGRVVELGSARHCQDLWDFLGIQIFRDRKVGRRAQR